jgi:hypothetical protein
LNRAKGKWENLAASHFRQHASHLLNGCAMLVPTQGVRGGYGGRRHVMTMVINNGFGLVIWLVGFTF